MDGSSLFDSLTRFLAAPPATRRRVIGGLAGVFAATVPLGDLAAKKKRCKRKKRCGKGCCNGAICFAATVTEVDGSPLSFGCCSEALLCKSEIPNWRDECCYPDETCDPQLPNRDISATGICCRPCGGLCCQSSFECNVETNLCEVANTARLPRYRR